MKAQIITEALWSNRGGKILFGAGEDTQYTTEGHYSLGPSPAHAASIRRRNTA